MPLSNPNNWKLDNDPINADIWKKSPTRQIELCQHYPVELPDSVGGQQAMLPQGVGLRGDAANPVSWVPDLVGKNSHTERGVMVIGSAYAPFVEGYTGRPNSMPVDHFRNSDTWSSFHFDPANGFLAHVVNGDPNYYGRIEGMFGPAGKSAFDTKRVILSDWCRASFVKRGAHGVTPRPDQGGDKICRGNAFDAYLDENRDWHRQRIESFRGKIVLLGNLSHRCLRNACQAWNWQISYFDADEQAVAMPTGICRFWGAGGANSVFGKINERWQFVVVWHPSARGWAADRILGLRNWVDA